MVTYSAALPMILLFGESKRLFEKFEDGDDSNEGKLSNGSRQVPVFKLGSNLHSYTTAFNTNSEIPAL